MFTLFSSLFNFPVHTFLFSPSRTLFPVLEGEDIEKEHCVLDFVKGKVTFDPISSMCWVNGVAVTQATKLNQGMVNLLDIAFAKCQRATIQNKY